MNQPIRWGILGTGNIARQCAAAFVHVEDAELVAVGSRTRAGAEIFGEQFDIPRRHASYRDLAADPQVDVIYVATPNAFHATHAALCLRAQKAVLLEKPFTVNRKEAAELVALARRENVFLMEAMWTRFVPAVVQAMQWIAEGAIGEVRMVEASFGFRADPGELAPLISTDLATGSLLDVGVYPISLACAAFGRIPTQIRGLAELAENRVDKQASFLLGFEGGGLALGASAVTHETPHDAWIAGTKGRIHLHAPFWCATKATLSSTGRDELTVELPFRGNGYEYELEAVNQCLRAGRLEHRSMPLGESVEIMRILDALRSACGVQFPADL